MAVSALKPTKLCVCACLHACVCECACVCVLCAFEHVCDWVWEQLTVWLQPVLPTRKQLVKSSECSPVPCLISTTTAPFHSPLSLPDVAGDEEQTAASTEAPEGGEQEQEQAPDYHRGHRGPGGHESEGTRGGRVGLWRPVPVAAVPSLRRNWKMMLNSIQGFLIIFKHVKVEL